jgi:hypothetical protein
VIQHNSHIIARHFHCEAPGYSLFQLDGAARISSGLTVRILRESNIRNLAPLVPDLRDRSKNLERYS